MCGIFAVLQQQCDCEKKAHDHESQSSSNVQDVMRTLQNGIANRGPDGFSAAVAEVGTTRCTLGASVLHIQGDHMTTQPLIDDAGNILCWNGEAFSGLDRSGPNMTISDTILVARLLQDKINLAATSSLSDASDAASIGTVIADALSVICGPYAFIYFHKPSGHLFYGRDPFGRRSLLTCTVDEQVQAICSVLPLQLTPRNIDDPVVEVTVHMLHPNESWEEVPVSGIFGFHVDSTTCKYTHVPWPKDRIRLERNDESRLLACSRSFQNTSEAVGRNDANVCHKSLESNFSYFLNELIEAVSRRIACFHASAIFHPAEQCPSIPEPSCGVGVLFSGGIDSVLLTAVLHFALERFECRVCEDYGEVVPVAKARAIELINVSFETTDKSRPSPDRMAAIVALDELKRIFPSREWRLVHVDVLPSEREKHESTVRRLIQPCDTHMDLNIGTAFWFAARGVGYTRDYSVEEVSAALAAEDGGRPIVRVGAEDAAKSVGRQNPSCPSAIAENAGEKDNKCTNPRCGRINKAGCLWNACKRCCFKGWPGREFNGGKYGNCPVHKAKHGDPREDTADSMSILHRAPSPIDAPLVATKISLVEASTYICDCKSLLVGIGADEQMAGYGRHKTTFINALRQQSAGVDTNDSHPVAVRALEEELSMDLERLWKRNLGRDDRCVSDSGREAWFPYLDEHVVNYLQSLPMAEV
jgi:asparagine synthetase B (glutamine-hydrolysing)